MTTAAQQRYADYLTSPRWRLIRWLRRHLDGRRCRVCFSTHHLEVHHRSYRHRGKSFLGEVRDTILLCRECHSWAHRKGLCQ